MSGGDDQELKVELSEYVLQQIDDDPELAEALMEFSNMMKKAFTLFQAGEYASMEDAVEALTGSRPTAASADDLEMLEGIACEALPTKN